MVAVSRRARRQKPASDADEAAPAPDNPVTLDFLDTIVGYTLRRAQTAVYTDYAQTVDALGVRPAQFAAMVIITANPGLTQSALSAVMGIDRSAAVSLIDFLEGEGWAERVPSPTDRRSYSIMITEAGRAVLERLKDLVAQSDRRVTAGLSAAERAVLMDLLRRMY
jgi:DNA-binding MarR family transcriptional regulator